MEAHLYQPDPLATPVAQRASSMMRGVNSNIEQLSSTFTHRDSIAFFCECGSVGCYSVIWLSQAETETTLADRRAWLLAEGHEPSAPWSPVVGAPLAGVVSPGREPGASADARRAASETALLDERIVVVL